MNAAFQHSKPKIYNSLGMLLIISYSLLIASCSSPTKNNKVTFSGTVTLEDTTHFSGVTVSLYAPVELDTALVRINEQYPNIGVQISQETEFDHREHEPLYTTTTKTDGSWEIKAEAGTYNIVAEKEGWGWKYDFTQNKTEIEFNLKKTVIVNSELKKYESGRHYILDKNIITNRHVELETGAVLRFKPNIKLAIENGISVNNGNGKYVKITSDDLNTYGYGLEINAQEKDITLSKLLVYKMYNGINFEGKCLSLEKSVFKECQTTAIILSRIDSIQLNNINIISNNLGINAFETAKGLIEKSIIRDNSNEGIKFKISNSSIKNNHISNNKIGIALEWDSNSNLVNNEINNNTEWGIIVTGRSKPLIENNNIINNNSAIYIPATGYAHNAQPTINRNNIIINFLDNNWLILISADPSNPNALDIDAKNNYWGTQDQNKIYTYIYDKYDDEINKQYLGVIIFNPYEFYKIKNSGIIK